MSLSDEHPRVMDRFGEPKFENLCLETSLQEIFGFKTKHVIELHASLLENAGADETAEQGVTLEKTTAVFLIEGEQFTSSLTDLSQQHLYDP